MDLIDINSIVYFFSYSFMAFALVTLLIYWAAPAARRNVILLFASYAFYCSWDYRFISLVLISTVMDFYVARLIEDRDKHRKQILVLSLSVNLGILLYFKYCAFFVNSFVDLAASFGLRLGIPELKIILPLGISFYTFQTMSYVIDVYRRKIKAHRNLLEFALFVSYFPQLIAGPIERTGHLLPQILREKKWKEIPVAEALYLFSWGFFKKRAIADFLAFAIENGYATEKKPGLVTLIGMIAFVFKLYADISGYADMARGVSLLFGIRLARNFHFPYFSRNPAEYWQRWHITLSVWARHYVFTPLITRYRKPVFAILTTFLVMGAWLGPEWHYIEWGLYWGFCSVFYQYLLKWNLWRNFYMIPIIFVGQSFFNVTGVLVYLNLLGQLGYQLTDLSFLNIYYIKVFFVLILFMLYDYVLYRKADELYVSKQGFYRQAVFYVVLFFLYRNIGEVAATDFVYFQH